MAFLTAENSARGKGDQQPKISPPAIGQQRAGGKYTVAPQLVAFWGHEWAGKKLPPIKNKNNGDFLSRNTHLAGANGMYQPGGFKGWGRAVVQVELQFFASWLCSRLLSCPSSSPTTLFDK